MSGRALYGRFAGVYEDVVPRPAGPGVELVDRLLGGVTGLVVDAGCGTGRYAAALAALGREVIGIDRSPEMIEEAVARGGGAEYVWADLLEWRPPRPVAAVLCRGVLNDLVEDDDRDGAFAAFGRWLEPGGVLVADVRDWEATARRHSEPRVHERGGYRSETRLDRGRRVLLVRERWSDGTVDDVVVRPWSAGEVRSRATAAGFGEVDIRAGDGVADDRLLIVALHEAAARGMMDE